MTQVHLITQLLIILLTFSPMLSPYMTILQLLHNHIVKLLYNSPILYLYSIDYWVNTLDVAVRCGHSKHRSLTILIQLPKITPFIQQKMI